MTRFSHQIFAFLLPAVTFFGCRQEKVDFSAEIKPILNKRCISCHGGVKQNGGFSVLFREEALDSTESGKLAIVPGDPDHSEMIRRINSTDPEVRMPYKEEPLTQEEINLLTQWIKEGAEWGDHWAYSPPKPVKVPVSNEMLAGMGTVEEAWARNDIDYFILEKLKEQDLEPSPMADKATLIRRVHMDLTGLPPTLEEAEQFFADSSAQAYEEVVDKLLNSAHFGEKWASWWLDLARYADTKGYEADPSRVIWRYRDYVIKSFNDDKPFDQFTVEQLAGDMLPDATDEQIIATAFHRNTMNNDEGGTDDEEFRIAAVIDRIGTTWEIFQSTTMSCVQCHSHPYDPIRHEEYYRSFAYFNNTRDEDVSGEHPLLRTYEEADQAKVDEIEAWVAEQAGEQKAKEVTRFLKTLEPKIHTHVFDQFENGELNGYKWLSIRPGGSARLKQVNLDNKSSVFINYSMRQAGGSFDIRRGNVRGELLAHVPLQTTDGTRIIEIPLRPSTGVHDLFFVFKNPALKKDQSVCTIEWFSFQGPFPGNGSVAFSHVKKTFTDLLNAPVENTPVFVEGTGALKRETRIFERGNWLVPGEEVGPAVPLILNAGNAQVAPDRLGFARWLVSPDNPLTARTMVNRFWEQLFGFGLVETLEDFGSQGDPPTHPELLDWLALRFMNDHDWSMKKLLRDIVLSATYTQDSRLTDDALQKDLRNEWLARAPRIRLSAEQIRDQALFASGLLSDKMYGKSVMPYQPEGIWMSVYNGEKWTLSKGDDQYRRGVYTFIKRTSPYPSLIMFDGSSREVCISRRIRTNTPLQALVTLNDPVFVDAARALAKRMMTSDTASNGRAIAKGYRLLTFRDIPEAKLNVLNQLYDDAADVYRSDTAALHALTREKDATFRLGAMTIVANALLNLDEVIMRE